jgi:outer membrane protein OmpA-like peptidoglycan-associated protein
MLKTVFRFALIVPLLTIGTAVLAAEPEPSATLTLEYKIFGVGVGGSKGEGVITLKDGSQHSFSIESANIGAFGAAKVVAAGRVYNLEKLEDFSGGYAAAGAGFAVIAGPGVSTLKNQRNDVRLVLQSTITGLAIGLGGSGTTIKVQRMIKGPTLARKEPKSYTMYFDFNSSVLNQPATGLVANIVDEWKGHSAKVTLVGHTDTAGSSNYNQALSEKRALKVQQTLIENGIPAFRLGSLGVGETKLAVDTPDNVPNNLNRRVEIRFE